VRNSWAYLRGVLAYIAACVSPAARFASISSKKRGQSNKRGHHLFQQVFETLTGNAVLTAFRFFLLPASSLAVRAGEACGPDSGPLAAAITQAARASREEKSRRRL
jgi:hypothetical protein